METNDAKAWPFNMLKAVVIHSGGMDSSICLALAIREFGAENVASLSFSYSQRHSKEMQQAEKIASFWKVEKYFFSIDFLPKITKNALTDHSIPISTEENLPPNTLVLGRNGLMARLGAIFAHGKGASIIYMGIMELESANSGYRDCSRKYMDLKQKLLRLDLDNPKFEIRTPLVYMTKKESLELAHELGILTFLLKETVTCYEGIPLLGCGVCPACLLRNQGLREFQAEHPEVELPYPI
ncbi:7-cyano-7-deazaguanine synthase [Chlamydiales bacterium STE3]|nr:7-cyano-7-deazaguanine synthase [Chlamydiales bacterium STE3]